MITNDVAWLLVEACRQLNLPMRSLRVCELGNQESGWNLRVPVKKIMEWLGAKHISIDLNGLDGALKFDLSKPLPDSMLGYFDLVTNAGTTEHVVTANDFTDQWQAFKSIHELAVPYGAFIHILPSENGYHCGCGYVYTHEFLPKLAEACGYALLNYFDSKSDKEHVAALLLKKQSTHFLTLEEFQNLGEILITGAHPMNNGRKPCNE